MKKLKISLQPLEPYFLGNERTTAFGELVTQRALTNPYFTRSNKLPSQSALFGILRYLGIKHPKPDFSYDKDDIGKESFHLLKNGQTFGKIHGISPLMLQDKKGKLYIPAPRNHVPVSLSEDKTAPFTPYTDFIAVETTDRCRYLPLEYNEKVHDNADFFCLDDGTLCGNLFKTQTRVGINCQRQKEKDVRANQGGFFKKEYIILHQDFSFLFYADVDDSFPNRAESVVFVGQGRTPFSVAISDEADKSKKWTELKTCFPAQANGYSASYAYVMSDLFYDGSIAELKQCCSLMLSESKDYRVFITNYGARNSKARYQKHEEGLRLIPAGSVFLFLGENRKNQMRSFHAKLEASVFFAHGQIAGFNHLFYQDGQETASTYGLGGMNDVCSFLSTDLLDQSSYGQRGCKLRYH